MTSASGRAFRIATTYVAGATVLFIGAFFSADVLHEPDAPLAFKVLIPTGTILVGLFLIWLGIALVRESRH